MPTSLTLTPAISLTKRSRQLVINLSGIFRNPTFKLAAETFTLLSLFSAAALWLIAF